MVDIPKDERLAIGDIIPGMKVVELGNKKNRTGLYRDWYMRQKAGQYVCLDWNSQDGAVAFDMGKPIEPHQWPIVGDGDLVTNFGFMEHVLTSQHQGWLNVALLTSKVGCRYAMSMPCPGYWEHHGVYQPTLHWHQLWLEGNGMDVDYISEVDRGNRRMIVARATRRRQFDPFLYYHPSDSLVHLTPRDKRRNPLERKHHE